MKKLIIFAVALLALGFAASSFAIQAEIPADSTAAIAKGGTQVTIGGEIRVRGAIRSNTGDFDRGVTTGTKTWGKAETMLYDNRVRLNVEAKLSPNTIGFIQMESAGSNTTGENTTWGKEGTVQRTYGGAYRTGDQKGNEFRVIQAWIQHSGSGLFGIPAYMKIGHQMITVGAGVFYSHTLQGDDAIVIGITPIKGLDLSFLTVKLQENLGVTATYSNGDAAADDQDLYSFIASYAINKDIIIGADASLLQSQNGAAGQTGKSDLYNFGFNAKAKIQGFTLKGTVDFQAGVNKSPSFTEDRKFRGFALTGGAAYTFAPVTLSFDLMYGSGDQKNDNKYTTFMTSQSDVVNTMYVYEYMTANGAGNQAGGIQNTFLARLTASADVVKNVNITGVLGFISAAQKAYGQGGYASSASVDTNGKYIGTEADVYATYQIDKGLKYFVESGYLFAGNYFKDLTYASRAYAPGSGDHRKFSDPWSVRHGIQLNF